MRVNISPKFILKSTLNKEKKKIIHCRLIIDRKKSEFSTGILIFEEDWNEQFSRSLSDKNINLRLSEIESKLQEITDKFYFDNKTITAKLIVETIKNKSQGSFSISEYINYYLYDKGQIKILAKGYSAKFITLKTYLEKYCKERYNTNSFDIRNVDFKFLSDFDIFLKAMVSKQYDRPLSPVYIQKMHSMFRTILISAHKEGVIRHPPYQNFPIKKVKTEIKYLSYSELERLKNIDLSDNISLEIVRDIFLFSVYTGLRFKDSQSITEKSIEYENNEPKYLIKYQEKTKDKVEIPILKPTLYLLNKYKTTEYRKKTGYLMPKFSNVKLNAYLKVIGDIAHIKLKLTHHVARHTCATTVLLENGVPLIEVSKWLGHADIKSTSVYAHVTRNKLGNTADRLDKLFKMDNVAS